MSLEGFSSAAFGGGVGTAVAAAEAAATARARRRELESLMSRPVPAGMVRLIPSSGPALTAIVDGPPDRSGGVGGWQAVEREGRRPAKWWQGWTDEQGSLTLILDLHTPSGSSVENRLASLYRMGQPTIDGGDPPSIALRGDVPSMAAGRWLLQDITTGARVWMPDGRLRRLTVTLPFERWQPLAAIRPVSVRRTRSAAGKRRARSYTTKAGDTLRRIAVAELGAPGRWSAIVRRNPKLRVRDPDRRQPAGVRLRLP